MKLLNTLLALLFMSLSVMAQSERLVIAVPSKCAPETASAIWVGVNRVIDKAPSGTIVVLFDAYAQKPLLTFEVPEGNVNRRRKVLKRQRASIKNFLKAIRVEEDPLLDVVHVPRLMEYVARGERPARVLLYANPFYRMPGEEDFHFGGDLYPEDGFLTASPRQSPFSCELKAEALKGVSLFWCHRGGWGETRYQDIIRDFWVGFLQLQGGTLAAWVTSSTSAVEILLREEVRSVNPARRVDPAASGLVMRRLGDAEVEFEKEAPLPPPPPVVYIVVAIDGSMSNGVAVEAVGPQLLRLARSASRVQVEIRIGVVAYRERDRTYVLNLTNPKDPVEMKALETFVEGEEIEATIVNAKSGAESGQPTGEKRLLPKLSALGGTADLSNGVGIALRMLGGLPDTAVPVVILCGDIGTQEEGEDLTPGDRARADRLSASVGSFLALNPQGRWLSIYTGKESPYAKKEKRSADFLHELANLADRRGQYTTDVGELERFVQRAIRAAEGVR